MTPTLLRRAALGLAACLSFAAAPASAAVLNVGLDGQLAGADGVNVNGTLYDVIFFNAQCIQAFDGCDSVDDFAFRSSEDAFDAATALFDQVLVDGPLGAFDTNPSLTFGCMFGADCRIAIPYAFDPFGAVLTRSANNRVSGDIVAFITASPTLEAGSINNFVYARFTLADTQMSEVPLPAALPLFLMGIAGLGAARSRRETRAH
ncbi:MAG: hypothetical protein GC152_10380 [Alphaproteobacteria bacterium]|nr:hypothetical protein [Alphaproteobacteria bacterium]